MISGLRLQEALLFQKSHIEKGLWETAAKMFRIERNLNVLRVEETIGWHSACEGKLNDNSGSIKRVGEIIDMKLSRAEEAIVSIQQCLARIGELRSERKAAESRVIEMREELKEKTRINQDRSRTAPEVVEIKETIKALKDQLNQTSADYAYAIDAQPSIMAQFDRDRAFQYLFKRGYGTSTYSANAIVSKMDAWLADKIDFMYAANLYQSAVTMESKYDDFMVAYADKRTELENLLDIAEQDILQELDEARFAFAEAVNSVDDIDKKIEVAIQKMEVSKDIVKDMLRGGDNDFRDACENLIKLLAKEKAAAAVRLSKNHSPEVIVARNKATALNNERLTLSAKADGMRVMASTQDARAVAVDELLRRLNARKWLSEDTYFELNEHSKFFIEVTFGDSNIENAWKLLQQAYLPADKAFDLEAQEISLTL